MRTRLIPSIAAVFALSAFAETLVFDPGEGNVTNVTDYLRHTVGDVSVASGTVNLLSPLNVFAGDVSVASGATLGFSSLSADGVPNSLGFAENIVLAPGTTLRYLGAGPETGSAALTFNAAAAGDVLTVDSDGDFAFLGAMSIPQDSCGRFVKTGTGTFTVGTTALPEGETNYLARAETASPYAIDVKEGGLAIATGDDVTTVLGSKAYTYTNATGQTKWEYRGRTHVGAENKSAHLDIVSGNVLLAEKIYLGAPGATTALNMYGGSFNQIGTESYINIGDVPTADIEAGKDPGDSSLNIYGGSLTVQYIPLTLRRGTKGRIYMSGGMLSANIYAAHDPDNATTSFDDPLVPEAEIYVCTNAYLKARFLQLARSGLSRVRVTVADGGTLEVGSSGLVSTKACDGVILLDGGNLVFSGANQNNTTFPTPYREGEVTFKIGAQGATLTASAAVDYTVAAPFATGVTGGPDGGLAIRAGAGTVRFTGGTTYTGPTYLAAGAKLRLSADMSLASLVASDSDITLRYDVSGTTVPLLTVGGFDVPGTVTIMLNGTLTDGTYDILSAPESADVDPTRFLLTGASESVGARFAVRVSGGRKIISLTRYARTLAVSSWQTPAGGAWETAANWDNAPAASTETRVNFAVPAAVQDNAVTLASPFTLGGMTFAANPGYSLSGATLTLENAGSAAKVFASAGTNTIAAPISVTGAASFGTTNGAELVVSGIVSGGQVTANPNAWPYSSGTVRLSGANTFTGTFKVNTGKAVVPSIANSGTASPVGAGSAIEIGKGTFEFAGGVGSTDRTFILNPGDVYRMAAIGVADGSSLTLTGPMQTVFNGLNKTGKGTLTLNAPYDYAFDAKSYSLKSAWDVYSSWGDSLPPIGGLVVTSGRLAIGPSVKTVTMPDDLIIGTRTTDKPGAETGAEMVINGGEMTVGGYVIIGHDNGMLSSDGTIYTGETSVLTNRLTVNGGLVTAYRFDLGYQYYKASRQHSELVVNGGRFVVANYSRIGVLGNSIDNISSARIVVNNGGMVDLSGQAYIGAGSPSPVVEIEINDGGVYKADQFRYSYPSALGLPHVATVNEGGALRIKNGINCAATPRNAGSHILFEGGTYQPCGTSSYFVERDQPVDVQLGEKGAVFDTSCMPATCAAYIFAVTNEVGAGNWTTKPGVATDGGIAVVGPAEADRAIVFYDAAGYDFNGPVTVKAGGVALARTTSLSGKAVTVKASGTFGAFNSTVNDETATVASLTLEDGATIAATYYGAGHNVVRATGSLSQAGTVYVLASNYGYYRYNLATTAGTYPVVRGPVGSLDASKFALSPRYAASSSATFSLVHGDGYDEVQMTITSASPYTPPVPSMEVKTWDKTTGGNWLDGGNWDNAPADACTDHIVLPATLSTTPATISLGGERTLGLLSSSVNGEVTLADGALNLTRQDLGTYPVVSNTCGTLILPAMTGPGTGTYAIRLEPSAGATQVITGPITSPTRIFGNSTYSYGGTIRFESPNTEWLETKSGTVEGAPENLGAVTYDISRSTVRFTDGGVCHANVLGANGFNLRTEGDVFCLGKVQSVDGPFIKTGKGTAYLLSQNAVTLGANKNNNASPSDSQTMAWQMPANGDVPDGSTDGNKLAVANFAAGKVVLGLTGAKTTINSHARLGCSLAEFDENGDVLDAEVEVRGGKLVIAGDLYIARNAGFYRQYHDSAKRRTATFSLYDGEVEFNGTYMAHDSTGYFNGDAILNVYGGLMKSQRDYIIFNAHRTSKMTGNGQSHSYINIYGGMFTNTYYLAANEPSGGGTGGLKTHTIQSADFDLNLFGGDFAWTSALTADPNAATVARLNLAGGRLTARYVRRNSANGTVGFFWNGGIYQPTRNGATMKGRVVENGADVRTVGKDWSYNTCSTNGAYFQIPAGNTFTLDQALTHDADLGDTLDGGLASIGEGTLVLGVANTFTGPVKAISGTMQVDADGAVPAGVDLELSGGTLDLNSHNVTVRNVTGAGGWARNGTVTVTGAISVAGGAEAWVGMDAAVFGDETVFTPNYSYSEATDTWTGDYLKFNGSATGWLAVDLRRTAETPLSAGFRLKIAELPAAASGPALRVLNWGDNPKASVMFSRNVEGETAEIYVEVIPKGTTIVFR